MLSHLQLRFDRQGRRIDMHDLTGGRAITVCGQHEVMKDLIRTRLEEGGEIIFEASHLLPEGR